jgi:hypothetical protein
MALVAMVAFSVYGVLDLSIKIYGSVQNPNMGKSLCNCGNSTTEALLLGCKFVPMAAAWLPRACRDDELSFEFDHAGPGPNNSWAYFADKPGTPELGLDEVALLADVPGALYFTTREWHIVHCVYYWKKLHRSRSTGVVVEPRYDSEKHIDHCLSLFFEHWETGSHCYWARCSAQFVDDD